MFAAGALENGRRSSSAPRTSALFGFAVAAMVLLVGLRYEIGPDWQAYIELFRQTRHLDFPVAVTLSDPGYAALNWLAHRLGVGFWGVNLFCAAALGLGLLRFTKAQPSPWLAMLIAIPYLVVVVGMSATRQAAAIGFMLLALPAFARRSWVAFWFWSLLATLFHVSAFVLVLLAGIALARNVTQKVVMAVLTAFFGYFLLSPALDTLVQRYSSTEVQSQGAGIRLVMNIIPALLFLAFSRKFNLPAHEKQLWTNLSIAGILSAPLLFVLPSSTVLDRLSLYVAILQIFTLSRLPFVLAPRIKREVIIGLVVYSAAVQAVWLTFSTHSVYWTPYRFYPLVP